MFGENGLIKKAEQAKEYNDKAQLEEKLKLCEVEARLDNKELKDILIKEQMIDEASLETKGILKINNSTNFFAISNSYGLEELSTSVKEGNDYSGVVIYLLNDITFDVTFDSETGELLSGKAFEPIGDSNSRIEDESLEGSIKKEFNGTFKGLNHEIKNLYINENSEGTYCTGLFGYIGEEGIVENVIISDSYISGNYETGSIVGRNRGAIKNCINKSSISANKLTGGIAGRNCGTIEECINYGDINTTKEQTGGIVSNCDFGENIKVSNCKNYGNITSTSNMIGGIVGATWQGNDTYSNVNVEINNCENYGSIGGEESNYIYIGGIVGRSRANVSNCINNGNINGYQNVGGIMGHIRATASNCINKGNIKGYESVGGIVGMTKTSTLIENCKNYSSIVGNYRNIGGICGFNSGRNNLKMQ